MIIIGADIVPTESNIDLFVQGNLRKIIGKSLVDILDHADYRIFNLEAPLTEKENPIHKYGPNLKAPVSCTAGLKDIGVDLLTLANNHILDQNEDGLLTTVHSLNKAGISYVGVGKNIHEACKPFYFNVSRIKYGVYACTEHEFSIAGELSIGANPFEALDSLDHISKMRHNCDFAIVLYHGGKEHYRYPSPYLKKVCRKIIEKGANLVICQHSHCIGCEEKYLGGTIVYGQGNFLFDLQDNEYWNSGLLVGIMDDYKIEYFPIVKASNGVELATGETAHMIMSNFYERSMETENSTMIEEKYQAFAKESLENYMINISGIKQKVLYRALNKLRLYKFRRWLLHRAVEKYQKSNGIAIRNYVECESHRELLLKGLTTL